MSNAKYSSTATAAGISLREKASSSSMAATVSKALPSLYVREVESFFIRNGCWDHLAENNTSLDFYSHLFRHLLKVKHVYSGRVSCFFSVLPAFTVNFLILSFSLLFELLISVPFCNQMELMEDFVSRSWVIEYFQRTARRSYWSYSREGGNCLR